MPSDAVDQCRSCKRTLAPTDVFCTFCGARRPPRPAKDLGATGGSWSNLRSRLEEGTRGEFEILEELGRGGMGAVYLAKEKALDRKVAVKVLFPHLMADPTNLERFRHEARIVAALRHPNIVNIHTVRDLGDLHFFVMDLVEGASLKKVIAAHGPLPIPVVEAVCYQVASALGYAHRQGSGVIHRDIKPSNIMLDREGNAVVMDFGLSKALDTSTGLTKSGAVVGTPEYMSPEQGRGDFLTTSSDQYAFGLVVYAMITGAPPFTGTQFQVLIAHAHHDPEPVRDHRPDCPEALAQAVEKMLSKSPSGRWPELADFLKAIGGRPPAMGDPVLAETGALVEAAIGVQTEPEGIVSLTLSNPPTDLRPGDRFVIDAQPMGPDGSPVRGKELHWSSSDPGIVTVSPEGGDEAEGAGKLLAQAMGEGTARLEAECEGIKAGVDVMVLPAEVARVWLSAPPTRLDPGESFKVEVTPMDRRGAPLQPKDISWEASDPSVLRLTPDGRFEAKAPGQTRLTVRVGGKAASVNVTVGKLPNPEELEAAMRELEEQVSGASDEEGAPEGMDDPEEDQGTT